MSDGKYLCSVIPVYLKPRVDVADIAAFGVIVVCDETGYKGFKIAINDEKVTKRLLAFFPEYGCANLMQAYQWAEHDIDFAFSKDKASGTGDALMNLIRPRENVIRYGSARMSMAKDPAVELEKQYALLVSRS